MSANYGYTLDPGFKGILSSVGIRYEDVLRRVGLPEDALNRPYVRVSAEQFFAFARAVEVSVEDHDLPIRLVEGLSAEWFSPPAFAALCSPNLTVAASRLATFKPLVVPVDLQVETDAAGITITYHWRETLVPPSSFLVGSEALFLVQLVRMGTRHEVCPTRVTLPTMPRGREAYEAFFGCPIESSAKMSLRFDAQDAARPFLSDNHAMWEIFEPELRRRLAELHGESSFEERVRAVLVEALPSGQVSVEAVATRLAVSTRTLQRRLREEQTTFKSVVRETRLRLSQHYLERTQLSYSESAYLLGFQEPNSFFRAFQSWMGTTPESLRQSLQSNH